MPAPPPRPGLRAALALAALVAGPLLAAAVPGRAQEAEKTTLQLSLEQIEAGSGYVWTDFSLLHALQGKTRDDLRHGRPLTFLYTVELWRERSHWFDALIASHTLEVRLRYDPWQEIYAVAGLGADIRQYLSPEEAEAGVSSHLHLRTAKLDQMEADKRYYLVIRADIKTLTLHDLNEVEGWLRGEVQADGDRSSSLSIPRSLMRVVLGVSGLGDRSAVLRSEPFEGTRLGLGAPAAPPPPAATGP
ncbi:MAG TPA: DUF4390 domain-containing protein [Candidatus Saccharimonadales bacterium]|nr:DUF4390 domain-containing protein [Candidatus Saccharimonadales bacterium]